MTKKIPNFRNYEEEAKFWDENSLSEYWDQFKDIDLVVNLNKPKTETLIMRLQKEIKRKLEKVASKKGLKASTLGRIWLTERLQSV